MAELRNVIIFAAGGARYALELRWVREVVSLGFVTGVPTAPAALGGVCNLHGQILPVLDVGALLDLPAGSPARQGDGGLVIETEGVVCALRVDQVDHVASLHEADDGVLVDAGGRPLTLLDPATLVRRAQELITAAANEPAGALPTGAV
ncbi:MAG: chemotaxis protein CheW [Kofleriaceae bacterium]